MGRESVVAEKWELSDPNPDPVILFKDFNKKFFDNQLSNVTVKWSSRMTSCAGNCDFKGKREGCVINLSVPLLAFRSRKDLVETLLHEMIHAYLFLVDGDKEREEHGPKFMGMMTKINRQAGCNMTVEHDFNDEVEFLQSHVWKCSGPCAQEETLKGIVRRSVNRPPGPSEPWWQEHQKHCKGKFTKISEPVWSPARLCSKSKTSSRRS